MQERQSTIEEINLVYTTKYIKEIFNQQKYIDEINVNINNDLINNDPILTTFCFAVGSLLQVVYYIFFKQYWHIDNNIIQLLCSQIIDSIFENEIRSGISVSLPIGNLDENEGMCILNAPEISANYAINKYFLKRCGLENKSFYNSCDTCNNYFNFI